MEEKSDVSKVEISIHVAHEIKVIIQDYGRIKSFGNLEQEVITSMVNGKVNNLELVCLSHFQERIVKKLL